MSYSGNKNIRDLFEKTIWELIKDNNLGNLYPLNWSGITVKELQKVIDSNIDRHVGGLIQTGILSQKEFHRNLITAGYNVKLYRLSKNIEAKK
jgi:hypothetical protein